MDPVKNLISYARSTHNSVAAARQSITMYNQQPRKSKYEATIHTFPI